MKNFQILLDQLTAFMKFKYYIILYLSYLVSSTCYVVRIYSFISWCLRMMKMRVYKVSTCVVRKGNAKGFPFQWIFFPLRFIRSDKYMRALPKFKLSYWDPKPKHFFKVLKYLPSGRGSHGLLCPLALESLEVLAPPTHSIRKGCSC